MIAHPTLIVPDAAHAETLARIHATCFEARARWSAKAFLDLGAPPQGAIFSDLSNCVLALRMAADEAEVLTVGVRPSARRTGLGRLLMAEGINVARSLDARRLFLEVSVDNAHAHALYRRLKFAEIARRKDYYRRADGSRMDAVVMALDL